MNYSFLFAPVAALAVSFSVSLAESRIPAHPADPLLRPASGSLKAGYSTRYEFRGLIPAGCNQTAPVSLDWRSDLNEHYSFILALKEELFPGRPAIDLDDETVVDLGFQRKLGKAAYAAFSLRNSRGRFKKACRGSHQPPVFWGQGGFFPDFMCRAAPPILFTALPGGGLTCVQGPIQG